MTTKTHYYQAIRDPRPAIDWRAMLTQLAFGLALALAAARCMLLETIRDPFDVNVGSTPIPRGAGADTSLFLDLLCCLPAILVLGRRCLDKTYTLRCSGSLVLIVPLAGWMALSAKWADDKFADIVSTGNFLAAMALLWATAQLVRSWMRLRIVAAAAFGLLLVFLVHGFDYKFDEMPLMKEHQSTLLRQGGFDPNSFSGIQFAKKMEEMVGFNASPNSFAGMIVLLMAIGLGAAIQRIKDGDDPGWAAALGLSAPLAIWLLVYTQSKAAMVMPVLVAALFAVWWKWRGPLARRSKRWFWIGVGIVAVAILAALGHGLYRHGLPTSSLNFRWRYWVGSWRMFLRHPLRGTGWENFGPHYLRDRLPVASEEIHDPHDFIVRFFVELGAVGGILLLAWLGRQWWELTRPAAPPVVASPLSPTRKIGQVLFLAGIAAGSILINIFASIDFNQGANWVLLELILRLLYFCALVIGLFVVALRSLEKPQVDERAAQWVLYGILIGVGVFLIHNLIEFSMFEPGPLCLLGVLLGSALGIRLGNPPVRKPGISPGAIAGLAAVCVAWLAALNWIFVPIARAEAAAQLGDEKLRAGDFPSACDEYAYAATIFSNNADYPYRAARALHFSIGGLEVPLTDPGQIERAIRLRRQILTWYALAIARDPAFLAAHQLRAIFALQMNDSTQMIADFDRVLQLNPNEVSLRLEYAHDLELLHLLPQAKEQYKLALMYNHLLDPDDLKRKDVDEATIQKEITSLPD
ncbi:MAG: O-antigen ligase family protein [Tepidisphaeraceae bacterium]|jgi:O-antigen ligase